MEDVASLKGKGWGRRFGRLRRRFLDGPDWIAMPGFLRGGGYRSPAALLVAWAYAFAKLRLTRAGMLLALAGGYAMFAAAVSPISVLRMLALAAAAYFAVDFLAGWLARPKLAVWRQVPGKVTIGAEFQLSYEVANLGRRRAWDVLADLCDPPPGLKRLGAPCGIESIDPGGRAGVSQGFIALRRGRYLFSAAIAAAPSPLMTTLWPCRRTTAEPPGRLVVRPKSFTIKSMNLPVGRRHQRHGDALISKVGESMEFVGCRDFRDGDDPRRIHWRSTARTGKLVVREYREEYLSRVALVLDTFIGEPPGHLAKLLNLPGRGAREAARRLEAAVSLTASVADYLAGRDCVVDIFAAGPEIFRFNTGRSLGHLDDLLDALAGVAPCAAAQFAELQPAVMAEISDLGCAVMVLLRLDAQRAEFVETIRQAGVDVGVYVLDDGGGINLPGVCRLDIESIESGTFADML